MLMINYLHCNGREKLIYDLGWNCDSSFFWPSRNNDNTGNYPIWNIWIQKPTNTIKPSSLVKHYHVALEVTTCAFLDFTTMLIRLSLQGKGRCSYQQRADGVIIHKGRTLRCGAEETRAHLGYISVTCLQDIPRQVGTWQGETYLWMV